MGYTHGHYNVKMNVPCQMNVKIKRRCENSFIAGFMRGFSFVDTFYQMPVVSPFFPNVNSTTNMIASTFHRYGRAMPNVNRNRALEFLEFSKKLIREAWPSTLKPGDVPGVEEWLEKSSYGLSRQEALKSCLNDLLNGTSHDPIDTVKSFLKREEYMEPKQPRSINSFSDESKSVLGPLFKAIDALTFGKTANFSREFANNRGSKFFVKGSRPDTWPKRMFDLFGREPVYNTDFSSFEAHHSGVFAKVVYYWYLHMIRDLKQSTVLKDLVAHLMLGLRNIKFKHISVEVLQRLMSGALWTSSANGVLNFCINAFVMSRGKGRTQDEMIEWVLREFKALFEGDDGIFAVGDHVARVGDNIYAELGIVSEPFQKMFCADFTEAGFCSITCAMPSDDGKFELVKDPYTFLRKFIFLGDECYQRGEKFCKSMYRARALSALSLYPNAPVISSLCRRICDLTSGYDVRPCQCVIDERKREFVEDAINRKLYRRPVEDVSDMARRLVERNFGIPSENQIELEKSFDSQPDFNFKFDMMLLRPSAVTLAHSANFVTLDPKSWTSPPKHHTHPLIVNALESGVRNLKSGIRQRRMRDAALRHLSFPVV